MTVAVDVWPAVGVKFPTFHMREDACLPILRSRVRVDLRFAGFAGG